MFETIKNKIFKSQPSQVNIQQPPIPKIDRDTAYIEDALVYSLMGGFEPYNPDELVQKKGADIYKKMMRDPQIRAAYNLRVNIIISRNFRFIKTNDDPVQDEMIAFFKENMNRMNGTWIGAMRAALLCKANGFSISEKLFESKKYKGSYKWMLKAIKAKPFNTFEFRIDKFGNLVQILQKINGEEIKLDPDKFIYMVNHPEMDSIYGESDLRAAYTPYWSKITIEKMLNIYLERMAGGFVVATPNDRAQALSPLQRTNFENVLKNISMYSSVIPPMGYDVKIEKAEDTEAFEAAIIFYNTEITKSLMIPDLVGFSERQKVGSRALGEIQLETFMMTLNEDGEYLADTFNEQLWKQLAMWNYGVEEYPRMKFDSFTEFQARKIAGVWISAVEKGAVVNTFEDELRTRELIGYGKRDEDDERIEGTLIEGLVPPAEEPEVAEENAEKEKSSKEPKEEKSKTKKEENPKMSDFHSNNFSDRINANYLNERFDSLEESMRNEYSSLLKEISNDSPSGENESGLISSISKSKINNFFKTKLKEFYDFGRQEAQKTIQRVLKDKNIPIDDYNAIVVKLGLSQYKTSKNDVFSIKDFVDRVDLQQADTWFKQKSFDETGNLVNNISQDLDFTVFYKAFHQAQLSVYCDPQLGDFIKSFDYNGEKIEKDIIEYENVGINDKLRTINSISCFRDRFSLIPVTLMD